MNKIYNLAYKLIDAKLSGKVISPSEYNFLKTTEEAYSFQDISQKLLKIENAGWKIGATSLTAQKYLNTQEPVTAPIFKDFIYQSRAVIGIFTNQNTSVECEFGFKFKKHLPPKTKKYNLNEIISAIDCLIPIIEIIASRFKGGFENLGPIKLIADMVVHKGLVKGIEINKWENINLTEQNVELYRNGSKIISGYGSDVLGSPLNVLEWSVNHLSERGKTINPGNIISTGTCTGIIPIFPGDNIVANFVGLDTVKLDIADPSSPYKPARKSRI